MREDTMVLFERSVELVMTTVWLEFDILLFLPRSNHKQKCVREMSSFRGT